MLNVTGASTFRGALSLFASAATIVAGLNSPALQSVANKYSSFTNAVVRQNFACQAVSTRGKTENSSTNLALPLESGSMYPVGAGLSISPVGSIHLAPGQTFPGAGTPQGTAEALNPITAVDAGQGLMGGGSSGHANFALSPPIALANGVTGPTSQVDAFANLDAQAALGSKPPNPGNSPNDLPSKSKALSNLNGSVTLYPEWYGAVGDDVHDDTAAIRATYAACPSNACTVRFTAKTYKITGTIYVASTVASPKQTNFHSLLGEGAGATDFDCRPTTQITACIEVLDGDYNVLRDFSVQANANVTYGVDVTVSPSRSYATEHTDIQNVWVNATPTNSPIVGVALGPDTIYDVSHTKMFDVTIAGGPLIGFLSGNGTSANVLDNDCFGCTVDGAQVAGVKEAGGGLNWHGGGMDRSAGTNFLVSSPSSQPLIIDGIRSENSAQFFLMDTGGGTSPFPSVAINGVLFANSHNLSPATYMIQTVTSAPISITNSQFNTTNTVQFSFRGTPGHPEPVFMSNIGTNNSAWPAYLITLSQNPLVSLFSVNDYYIDKNYEVGPGSGKLFASGSAVFNGGVTSQVSPLHVTTNRDGIQRSVEARRGPISNNQSTPIVETPTYTPGENVTSCKPSSGYTNSDTRGELTIVGGTATTGKICTLNFSAPLESPPGLCTVWQNGGGRVVGVAHGMPNKLNFTILATASVAGATVSVDYFCQE